MVDLALTDNIFTESKIEEAIQELDILFNTVPTELIGDTTYGSNFLQFLWSLTPMEDSITKYIYDRIAGYTVYAASLKKEINVTKYDDVNETIYVIEISLFDEDDNEYHKEYTLRG